VNDAAFTLAIMPGSPHGSQIRARRFTLMQRSKSPGGFVQPSRRHDRRVIHQHVIGRMLRQLADGARTCCSSEYRQQRDRLSAARRMSTVTDSHQPR